MRLLDQDDRAELQAVIQGWFQKWAKPFGDNMTSKPPVEINVNVGSLAQKVLCRMWITSPDLFFNMVGNKQ